MVKRTKAQRIMDLSSDILEKYHKDTGLAIAEEPLRSEFLYKAKKIGMLSKRDVLVLEELNYHTDIKILIEAGLAKYPEDITEADRAYASKEMMKSLR